MWLLNKKLLLTKFEIKIETCVNSSSTSMITNNISSCGIEWGKNVFGANFTIISGWPIVKLIFFADNYINQYLWIYI